MTFLDFFDEDDPTAPRRTTVVHAQAVSFRRLLAVHKQRTAPAEKFLPNYARDWLPKDEDVNAIVAASYNAFPWYERSKSLSEAFTVAVLNVNFDDDAAGTRELLRASITHSWVATLRVRRPFR